MSQACRLLLWVFLAGAQSAVAQYAEVRIGVDGLTCSQCTRSVEMQLRRLDVVKDVRMNLEHTNGIVRLDSTKNTDLSRLAKAVKNAGFSVRYIRVPVMLDSGSSCITRGTTTYQLLGPAAETAGSQWVQVLDAGLMSRREWRRWEPQLKKKCTAAGKIVFVTLAKEEPL